MISRRVRMVLGRTLALVLGLTLRLWFIHHAARIAGDSLIYGNIARNWMQSGVYGFATSNSGSAISSSGSAISGSSSAILGSSSAIAASASGSVLPTLIRLPGYPLFLMACFKVFGVDHYGAVLYVQCAVDLLTCLLISALAGRLFGQRPALAALFLSALCPFTASYVAAPLTETLTLFTIALTFYGLECWRTAGLGYNRWLWVVSAAMAYAVLLRPEQGLLAAAVVPAMLWMGLGRGPGVDVRRQRTRDVRADVPMDRAVSTDQAQDVPTGRAVSTDRTPNVLTGLSTQRRTTQRAQERAQEPPEGWPNRPSTGQRSLGRTPRRLRAVAPVLLAAFGVVLPLVPWTMRNWRTFHVIEPLAPRYATDPLETVPLGFERWYRTWAVDFTSTDEVYWNYDGANVAIGDLPTRAFDSDAQYARTDALLADYNETDTPTPQIDARFQSLAEERIHADPLRYYAALPLARFGNMLLRPRTEMLPVALEWWKWREHPGQSAFAAAFAALNLAFLAAGAWGVWLWRQRAWDGNAALAWSMAGFVLLRSTLLLTLDNSEPRYTLEFFPIFIVWSALVWDRSGLRSSPVSGLRS